MLTKLLIALTLMALCVLIHALGVLLALRHIRRSGLDTTRFWKVCWMLILMASWMILLHLLEITIWAVFYAAEHGMPNLETAMYFSAVTYTTTGYGDLVLPAPWRLVGAVEALTGILMCGWSTGFFFAIVSRLFGPRLHPVAPVSHHDYPSHESAHR